MRNVHEWVKDNLSHMLIHPDLFETWSNIQSVTTCVVRARESFCQCTGIPSSFFSPFYPFTLFKTDSKTI